MNRYDNLIKLKELLDSGILNQEEYDAEKKKFLIHNRYGETNYRQTHGDKATL